MNLKSRKAFLKLIRIKKHALQSLIKDHVDDRKENEPNENTLKALIYWYKKFRLFLYGYDKRNVSLANAGIGTAFKDYLESAELGNWSIQLQFKTFIATLNKLDIPHNLQTSRLFKDYAKANKASEDFFMDDQEIHELMATTPQNKKERIILHRFIIACFTGCRISEVTTVTVENATTLRYTASKNKKDILVPYSDPVRPYIESALFRTRLTLFDEGRQNYFLHAIMKRLNWNEKVKTYKLYNKKKITEEIPKWQAYTFHSGRKFFGKMLLDMDVSIYKVSQLLGHGSVQTTEKFYAGVTKEKLIDEAGAKLNNF